MDPVGKIKRKKRLLIFNSLFYLDEEKVTERTEKEAMTK
jgi:hypothetical protein